jgi:hypothetical protein
MAAPSGKIEVEGRRELVRALGKMGERSGQLREVHSRLAVPLAMAARGETPVRSGTLVRTVRANASQKALQLRAGSKSVPYAGAIHYGYPRRGIEPNPFLIRARDAMRGDILDAYNRYMAELIDKVGTESFHAR